MEERKGVIYGLYCVCENCKDKRERIRYVGQTVVSKPSRRLDQHRFESRSEGAYLSVHLWIRKHGYSNVRMKILESGVPESQLDDRETYWIAEKGTFKDDGQGGLNLTRDGKGSEITDKSRKRQRQALRKTFQQITDEIITQNRPGMSAMEVSQEIREAYRSDPELTFQEISNDLGIRDVKKIRRIIRNEDYFDPNYEPPTRVNQASNPRREKAGLMGDKELEKWRKACDIRRDWLGCELTSHEIGAKYGLHFQTIWHIVNNRSFPDPRYKNTRGRYVPPSVRKKVSRGLKGVKKPEGFGQRGEDGIHAKLTEIQVLEILERLAAGEKGFHLAEEYGVTPTAISCIKKGKSWAHLPRPEGLE